jgi:hypothetical protein
VPNPCDVTQQDCRTIGFKGKGGDEAFAIGADQPTRDFSQLSDRDSQAGHGEIRSSTQYAQLTGVYVGRGQPGVAAGCVLALPVGRQITETSSSTSKSAVSRKFVEGLSI